MEDKGVEETARFWRREGGGGGRASKGQLWIHHWRSSSRRAFIAHHPHLRWSNGLIGSPPSPGWGQQTAFRSLGHSWVLFGGISAFVHIRIFSYLFVHIHTFSYEKKGPVQVTFRTQNCSLAHKHNTQRHTGMVWHWFGNSQLQVLASIPW